MTSTSQISIRDRIGEQIQPRTSWVNSGTWLYESYNPDYQVAYRVNAVLHEYKSPYQKMSLVHLGRFGRALILDDCIQSAEADEFIYHENLVHPGMMAHKGPKTVFIGGGGEGATLREVLKHKTVEKVVMVDIDEEVVEQCKTYLEFHHKGSFDDPRVTLIYQDAKKYMEETDETFDVILFDLADPLPDGPCWKLYTTEFYRTCKTKLNPGGVLISQSGPCAANTCEDVFVPVHVTMKQVFNTVVGTKSFVPSFTEVYGTNIAFDDSPEINRIDTMEAEQFDELLLERLGQEGVDGLREIDGPRLVGIRALPKYLRQRLATADTSVCISENNPAFMRKVPTD